MFPKKLFLAIGLFIQLVKATTYVGDVAFYNPPWKQGTTLFQGQTYSIKWTGCDPNGERNKVYMGSGPVQTPNLLAEFGITLMNSDAGGSLSIQVPSDVSPGSGYYFVFYASDGHYSTYYFSVQEPVASGSGWELKKRSKELEIEQDRHEELNLSGSIRYHDPDMPAKIAKLHSNKGEVTQYRRQRQSLTKRTCVGQAVQ